MKKFFILGAQDLEMRTIEKLLSRENMPFAYAAATGHDGSITRCHPGNAGRFTNIISRDGKEMLVKPAGRRVILVECHPAEAVKLPKENILVVDHHKPGDPGYGKAPAEFKIGSSLGQVAQLLGIGLDHKELAVAAADHCLTAAYQGECPGIMMRDVLAARIPELAVRHRKSEAEVYEEISKAMELLKNPTHFVEIGNYKIPDFRKNGILPFMVEAGTIMKKNFLAHVDSRPGFELKVMLNGNAAIVKAFLNNAANLGIKDTYGNPNRGFAGGVQVEKD